jgi:hypothetical protein
MCEVLPQNARVTVAALLTAAAASSTDGAQRALDIHDDAY